MRNRHTHTHTHPHLHLHTHKHTNTHTHTHDPHKQHFVKSAADLQSNATAGSLTFQKATIQKRQYPRTQTLNKIPLNHHIKETVLVQHRLDLLILGPELDARSLQRLHSLEDIFEV